MSEKLAKKTTERHSGIWLKITGLLLVVNILVIIVGSYIVYPTQAHRDVSRQLTEMSQKFVTADGTPVYETTAYKNLESTAEAQYSLVANIVVGVADFVLTVVLVGLVYNYLRKNRISKNHKEVGMTVTTNTVAAVLSWGVTLPLILNVFGTNMLSTGMIIFQLVALTIISLVIFFIVARIFEWQYNRKHSLIVE